MAMLSEKLNNVFADALKNLTRPRYEHPSVNTDHIEDPITKPIGKCENYQSIFIKWWFSE